MNALFEQAIQHQTEKKQLFAEVEAISEQMLLMEVDELIESVSKRGNLLERVSQQDEMLKALCRQDAAIKEMLNNSRLPQSPEEQQLYQLTMEVKAIANRLMQGEKTIAEYMQYKRSELRDKIEKLNASSQSTAKRYHQVIAAGIGADSKNFSRNF